MLAADVQRVSQFFSSYCQQQLLLCCAVMKDVCAGGQLIKTWFCVPLTVMCVGTQYCFLVCFLLADKKMEAAS